MPQPYTFQFGAWAPDLQNVPVEMPQNPGPVATPCTDCLNVFYQDGTYKCLPSPAAIAAQAPLTPLNVFSFYDPSTGSQLEFAADPNGIAELLSGSWTQLQFFTANTVLLAGQRLGFSQPNSISVGNGVFVNEVGQGLGFRLGQIVVQSALGIGPVSGKFTQGKITVAGQILSASMVATPTSSNFFNYNTGYSSGLPIGTFGSLTPSTDTRGNLISGIYQTYYQNPKLGNVSQSFNLVIRNPNLTANYFTKLAVGSYVSLTSASASFRTDGTYAYWVWATGWNLIPDSTLTLPVTLT